MAKAAATPVYALGAIGVDGTHYDLGDDISGEDAEEVAKVVRLGRASLDKPGVLAAPAPVETEKTPK